MGKHSNDQRPDGRVEILDAAIDKTPDIVVTYNAPKLPVWWGVAYVSALVAFLGIAGVVVWLLVTRG